MADYVLSPGSPEPVNTNITEAGDTERPMPLLLLCMLALVLAVVTGVGAVVFRDLIGLVRNALFLGKLSFEYDSSLFSPISPWGPFIILVPVLGSFALTFIVQNFAPEAKSHGVPEVMTPYTTSVASSGRLSQ